MNKLLAVLILFVLFVLYFYNLTGAGLLGPDEPRYAAIGREMARSGDLITPRLWGEPWFEKPVLLYWMEAGAFRLGLGEEMAPRLPVAVAGVGFLIYFYFALRREFGSRPAWFATAILGTSAGWVAMSYVGVTDLPMSAAFTVALLCVLPWLHQGEKRGLPLAAACLGLSVLAKGLVPLVLMLPIAWFGRRHVLDLVRPYVAIFFLATAGPWYAFCFARNGQPFLEKFFWEHQFGRFASDALQHEQPFWFYAPVFAAALLPWSPVVALMLRKHFYADGRRAFLLGVVVFGLAFFSASTNKLPGYVLPLLAPTAILMGLALAEAPKTRWVLAACGLCLIFVPIAIQVLPDALRAGISRAHPPHFDWTWLIPVALAAIAWCVRQHVAMGVLCAAVAAGVLLLKTQSLPAVDAAVSARPLWREIAGRREQVCVEQMHRSWRYGLNYYAVTPLPDCSAVPRPWHINQDPGMPPVVRQSAP